jgi:hypothetical protein
MDANTPAQTLPKGAEEKEIFEYFILRQPRRDCVLTVLSLPEISCSTRRFDPNLTRYYRPSPSSWRCV